MGKRRESSRSRQSLVEDLFTQMIQFRDDVISIQHLARSRISMTMRGQRHHDPARSLALGA